MHDSRYPTERTLPLMQTMPLHTPKRHSLDVLYPHEDIIPSKDNLEIAEAEKRMATEFSLNQSLDAL